MVTKMTKIIKFLGQDKKNLKILKNYASTNFINGSVKQFLTR